MATIVNNPGTSSSEGNSMSMLIGFILLMVFLVLLFVYGLPYLRGGSGGNSGADTTQINLPKESGNDAPQINIPDQVDVNLNTTQ